MDTTIWCSKIHESQNFKSHRPRSNLNIISCVRLPILLSSGSLIHMREIFQRLITNDVTAMSNHSIDNGDVFLSPKSNDARRRLSFSRQRQQAFCLAVNKNQPRRQLASVPSYYRFLYLYLYVNVYLYFNLYLFGRQQKPTTLSAASLSCQLFQVSCSLLNRQ